VPAYRDKHRMRQLFATQGLLQPRTLARFDTLEQVDSFQWESVDFPVIVKPVDLTSSLYVRLCHTRQEARAMYRRIFKHVQSFGGVSFSGAGLLESYIPGPEFSAECIVRDSEVGELFVTTKFVGPLPACDEIGHLVGVQQSAEHLHVIRQAAHQIVRAWKIERAVLHVEYKFGGGEVIIMESACRIGGDFIAELVQLQYGVRLEEELIAVRLGLPIGQTAAMRTPNPAFQYHGIRFLFATSDDPAPPEAIEVLREVRYARAEAPHQMHGIHDRLGYQVVRSRSLEAIKRYLGADCRPNVHLHGDAVQA